MKQTCRLYYTCTCDPVKAQHEKEDYVYARQVILHLPDWTKAYKQRTEKGYPATVCVDQCIKDLILELWDKGIETTGCCCGHNYCPAWVSVDPEYYASMFELGFLQKMPELVGEKVIGLYTFYL